MQILIRPTRDRDREAVLDLVREAFSDATRDGHEEVDVVATTWACGDAVRPIDLVAVDGVTVTGHVLGAVGTLGDGHALALAPLGVAPAHQGRGIGSALVREFLRQADEAGWPMVLLLGSPTYYGRFGFEPSSPLGIVYPPVGAGDPHFQVRRLTNFDPSHRGDFVYCWER